MDRSDAMALVGRKVRLFNHLGNPTSVSFLLARFDSSRRQFTTRNLYTSKESPLTVDELAQGLADNTLRIDKRN